MRPRRTLRIVASGLLVLAPGRARAQEAPPGSSSVLTLAEALERAARHHPAYRAALNDLDLSAPARRAARAAFLPSLSLSGGTTLTLNRRRVSEDFFGQPVENPTTEWESTSSSSQGIRGGVVLFQGGRRFRELAATGADARARAAAARAVLASVEAEVARRYLEAMRRRDLLELEEELLRVRREEAGGLERRYRLAGVGRSALLTARERLLVQRLSVLRARAAHEAARVALRRAVADPTLESFVLAPGPGEPARWDTQVEALVARALRVSPAVEREREAARAARARARAAGAVRWPTVELGFRFTQDTYSRERGALFDPFPDEGRVASAGLTVTAPLFGRLRTGERRTRAEVEAENARERLRRTRLDVEERVRSRAAELRRAGDALRLVRRVRDLAGARLALAREEHRLGIRGFRALQAEIENEAGARRAVIEALYRARAAEVDLRVALGSV